jgi:hypothetical protein
MSVMSIRKDGGRLIVNKRQRRKVISFSAALVVLLLVLLFPFAQRGLAAEVITGNPDVVIEADDVIEDDLFVSGAVIEIHGTIIGDVFASGQEVIIDGTVEGTLVMTGQFLMLDGEVDGSLVASGYGITFGPNASVSRSAYLGGFSFEAEEGSLIERSIYMGGYQLLLNGEVGRDVAAGAGAMELNGEVGGDLVLDMGEVDSEAEDSIYWRSMLPGGVRVIEPGFRQGDGAVVAGEIKRTTYPGVDFPSVGDPRPGGLIGMAAANWFFSRLGEFLAILIVGALGLRFMPGLMQSARQYADKNALRSAGYGCLSLVVFVVAVPLAGGVLILVAILGGFLTLGSLVNEILGLGGASLGLAIALFSALVTVGSKALVVFWVGRKLFEQLAPKMETDRFWNEVIFLAAGALLFELIRAIPIFGPLFGFVVTLIGLGAILYVLWQRWFPSKASSAEAAPAA